MEEVTEASNLADAGKSKQQTAANYIFVCLQQKHMDLIHIP